MKNFIALFIGFLISFECYAQNSDDYFWEGSLSDFRITDSGQIQLSASAAGKSFLAAQNNRILNTRWEFQVKLAFNPSSSNYADLCLCSDSNNLTGEYNGYFVRIGYSDRTISLYRRTGNRNVKIISGKTGRVNLPEVDAAIKIECSASGEWTLFSKLKDEPDFYEEGTISHYEYIDVNYFGLLCVYTITRNKGFYFEHIRISVLDKDAENDLTGAVMPEANYMIINEVLFNAGEISCEYVELFNRSDKTLDLSQAAFAIRRQNNTLSGKCNVATVPKTLQPGGYVVLTKNNERLFELYRCCENAFYSEVSLPALNNTGADLVLINRKEEIIDELIYSEKMHQKMIFNRKGISLERIDSEKPTQALDNWQTASFDSGYGTPGCGNSQQISTDESDDIWLENKVVSRSPNNAGLIINYRFKEPGQTANIALYDINGILVKKLCNNTLLGTSGKIEPAEYSDFIFSLDSGMYIVYIEYWNLSGGIRSKKLVFIFH